MAALVRARARARARVQVGLSGEVGSLGGQVLTSGLTFGSKVERSGPSLAFRIWLIWLGVGVGVGVG